MSVEHKMGEIPSAIVDANRVQGTIPGKSPGEAPARTSFRTNAHRTDCIQPHPQIIAAT